MLTADLVRARKRAGQLEVTRLSGKARERALSMASELLEITRASAGEARRDVRAEWSRVDCKPTERKLLQGLIKLVDDACRFDAPAGLDPVAVRQRVFELAAAERRTAPAFARAAVLERAASELHASAADVEGALFADLPDAQRLIEAPRLSPEALVERYDVSQLQAVLLRAVKVRAAVRCSSPEAYRVLFRKLKFRRLLHRIAPLDELDGYAIEIDGPYSLFESVTKYGLALATVLPALMEVDHLALEADVRWGSDRVPLTFWLEHRGASTERGGARLPDEVQALLDGFAKAAGGWTATPSAELIDLPGIGVCVPDIAFEHRDGRRVLLEVMGYWSRDAVWRRVELARSGRLTTPVIFAVSSRLRVSEDVLSSDDSAALYVYKGAMSARAVRRKLDALTAE